MAPFSIDFDKNSETFQIYQRLRKEGIRDIELDHGCHVIDYGKPGPNESLVGQGDQKISVCEVNEFWVDRYEKYRDVLHGITGGSVPWELEDGDATTDFDEKIRQKVQAATDELKALLKAKGLKPNSDEYQKLLAVGLYYFVDFAGEVPTPDALAIPQNQEFLKFFKKRTQELEKEGLGEFQTWLSKKGGLGTSHMEEDAPQEASALEALKLKRGQCTEKSKILYAVFNMAGLKPFFVFNKVSGLKKAGITIPPSQQFANHIYVGVSIGQQPRYFDLNIFNSSTNYPDRYPLRLRHFLAMDLSNFNSGSSGGGLLGPAAKDEVRSLRRAILMDPELPQAHANLGAFLVLQGQWKEAIASHNQAIALDPKNPFFHTMLGNTFLNQKKLEEAVAAFRTSLALNSENFLTHKLLGFALDRQGKPDEAIVALREAIKRNPEDGDTYRNLGFIFVLQSRWEEAIVASREALRLDPKDIVSRQTLEFALDRQKGLKEKEISSEKMQSAPQGGSFLTDRWQGWRMGGEASFNHYEEPGGGSKIWIGYRQERWDFRVAIQGEGIKLQEEGYDFRLGASFEPIFHLLQRPLLFDPYLNLPEIGFYHLFEKAASGLSFSPFGAGLQVHLNDSWSLYGGAKLCGAFTFEEKPKVGAEGPVGFSGHF